jgi:endoglucanase
MAWNQVTGCIDDPDGGNNSATDGDLDIAFALLLADKQWGSTGNINYLVEALYIIDAIKQNEVNQGLWIPILGDWVLPGSDEYDDTRSSDFMMDHFRAFQDASGNSAWNNAVNNCYTLVDFMQTNYSPNTGLLPDFIVHASSSPEPAAPDYLEGEFDGDYYYNACRTPFRIASDYLVSGDIRGKNAIQKINDWIRDQTGNDPSDIHAGYYLSGNSVPGSDYESAAFSGPFAVAAMVDASNQSWLNDTYNFLLSLELQDYEYYDNTLKLLCMLVLSGNYWVPQGVQGIGEDTFTEHIKVTAYPNPFSSSIIVSFSDLNGRPVNLSVDDVFGRTIYHTEKKNPGSDLLKTINLSDLSGGIYFLNTKVAGRQNEIKLLKY